MGKYFSPESEIRIPIEFIKEIAATNDNVREWTFVCEDGITLFAKKVMILQQDLSYRCSLDFGYLDED